MLHNRVEPAARPCAGVLLQQRDLIANWQAFATKNGRGMKGWTEAELAFVCSDPWTGVGCADGNVVSL